MDRCTEGVVSASIQLKRLSRCDACTEVDVQVVDSTKGFYMQRYLDEAADHELPSRQDDHSVLQSSERQFIEWIAEKDDQIQSLDLTLKLSAVKAWTAETPHLYTALITVSTVYNNDRRQTHHHAVKFGFRTLSISPRGVLLLNNRPLKLKGVNRHEFNMWKGIGTFASFPKHVNDKGDGESLSNSKVETIKDVRLIKQSNFNAIRMSHYPNDAYFYLLCDHMGVYVIDETNIETHGLWDYFSDNPNYEAMYIDRLASMYERDKNHPSIIMWSLGTSSLSSIVVSGALHSRVAGNEAGFGRNQAAMREWLKERDPRRPIHYEPAQYRSVLSLVIHVRADRESAPRQ